MSLRTANRQSTKNKTVRTAKSVAKKSGAANPKPMKPSVSSKPNSSSIRDTPYIEEKNLGSPAMSDKKNPPDAPVDRNVDQIRDILFGGQMRDYERRFLELGQKLEGDSSRLRGDMEQRVSSLEKRLDEQFDKLTKLLRQEVNDRSQADDDGEARLQQAARTMRNEINSAIDRLQADIHSNDERARASSDELRLALKDGMAQAERAMLNARDDLRTDKVGRQDLAALLTEVSMRLRGDFELPLAK